MDLTLTRTVILCQLFVPVMYVSLYAFIPESPRFLVYRGRYEEAEKVIRSLYNHTENVKTEVQLLRAQVEEQRDVARRFKRFGCMPSGFVEHNEPMRARCYGAANLLEV